MAQIIKSTDHFGQALRDFREGSGLSLAKLSLLVGMSPADLSHIERGRNITLKSALRLLQALDCMLVVQPRTYADIRTVVNEQGDAVFFGSAADCAHYMFENQGDNLHLDTSI